MRRLAFTLALGLLCTTIARADFPGAKVLSSSNITSATTTQVYGPVQSQLFIWWAGIQSSGTNSGATFLYETSAVAACASATTPLFGPTASVAGSAASGNYFALFGSNNGTFGIGMPTYITVPQGQYICVVSGGGTISYNAVLLYSGS